MFDHLVQSKVYTSNTSFTTTSPSPGQYCTDSTFKTILASICLNFTVDHIRDSIPRPWSIWPPPPPSALCQAQAQAGGEGGQEGGHEGGEEGEAVIYNCD